MTIFSGYRVAFRVDGGREIGWSSFNRCCALAYELEKYFGCKVGFFSSIEGEPPWGEPRWSLVTPPEGMGVWQEGRWLSWETEVGGYDGIVVDVRRDLDSLCKPLIKSGFVVVVIDEDYRGIVPSHLVVNASIVEDPQSYHPFNREQLFLLGHRYIILRPKFGGERDRIVKERAEHLVVSPGGGYPSAVWGRAIRQAVEKGGMKRISIFAERSHTLEDFEVAEFSSDIDFHSGLEDPSRVMAGGDIALCGGGTTLFEYISLGVPAVAITAIPGEIKEAEALASQGACVALTYSFAPERVGIAVKTLASRMDVRRLMSAYGPALIDGGGRERVALTVVEILRREKGSG